VRQTEKKQFRTSAEQLIRFHCSMRPNRCDKIKLLRKFVAPRFALW